MKQYVWFLSIFLLFVPTTVYGADWYDSNWLKTRSIEIDNSDIDSNLSNYPLYLNITEIDVGTDTQADCDDVVVVNYYNTTILPYELENCDSTNNVIELWVKIPTVYAANATRINLYYDNGAATDQQQSQSVWTSDYVLVTHLNGTANDSTSNGNDGTITGLSQVNTPLGDGYSKTNTADDINFGDIDETEGIINFSMEAWVLIDDLSGDATIMSKFSSAGNAPWIWYFDDVLSSPCSGTDKFVGLIFPTSGSARVCSSVATAINTWYHVVVVSQSGQALKIYVNNNVDTGDTSVTSKTTTSNVFAFEDESGGGRDFQGDITELRFSTNSFSAAWVKANYECQRPDGSCITIGDEQTEGAGGAAHNQSYSENLAITDTYSRQTDLNRSYSETLEGTDDIVFTGTGEQSYSENLGISDQLTLVGNDLSPDFNEAMQISDQYIQQCTGTCGVVPNANAIVLSVNKSPFILGIYSDATRMTCSASIVGGIIFNTDDSMLNVCDGTNWTFSNGTAT